MKMTVATGPWVRVTKVGSKFVHFGVDLNVERKFPLGRTPP